MFHNFVIRDIATRKSPDLQSFITYEIILIFRDMHDLLRATIRESRDFVLSVEPECGIYKSSI